MSCFLNPLIQDLAKLLRCKLDELLNIGLSQRPLRRNLIPRLLNGFFKPIPYVVNFVFEKVCHAELRLYVNGCWLALVTLGYYDQLFS